MQTEIRRTQWGFLDTLHGISDGDACDHNLIDSDRDGIVNAKDNCDIDGSLDPTDTNKIILLVNQAKNYLFFLWRSEGCFSQKPFAGSPNLVVVSNIFPVFNIFSWLSFFAAKQRQVINFLSHYVVDTL